MNLFQQSHESHFTMPSKIHWYYIEYDPIQIKLKIHFTPACTIYIIPDICADNVVLTSIVKDLRYYIHIMHILSWILSITFSRLDQTNIFSFDMCARLGMLILYISRIQNCLIYFKFSSENKKMNWEKGTKVRVG